MKKIYVKTFIAAAILHPLWTKAFQSETTSYHYFSPKDSQNLKSLHIGLAEVGAKDRKNEWETPIPKKFLLSKTKFAQKHFFWRGNFTPFISQSYHIWDHFFPLFFTKDSESLKTLDNQLQEVGAKRRLNGSSKVNTRTDGQTDL